MTRGLRTITVAELIDRLSDFPSEALVVIGADYGDRGRTEQALPIRGGEIEAVTVVPSAYSSSGFKVGEPDYDEEGDEASGETYVVLR